VKKIRQIVLFSVLFGLLLSTKSSSNSGRGASSGFPPAGVPESDAAAWREGLREAYALEQKGEHKRAAAILARYEALADRHFDTRYAATTFLYLGNNAYMRSDYTAAVRAYLRARTAAQRTGDREILSSASLNLSSLYLQHHAVGDAFQTAAEGVFELADPAFRSLEQVQRAKLAAARGDLNSARRLFLQAVDQARGIAAPALEATAWTSLGRAALDCGALMEAENALFNAYRTERVFGITHSPLTLRSVAELRLAQGDPRSALRFFDLALEASRKQNRPLLAWRYLYGRGLALTGLGDRDGAREAFRAAVEDLESSPVRSLPTDALRVSGGARLSAVYDAFVTASADIAVAEREPAALADALTASEAYRAAALRNSTEYTSRWRQETPAEYEEALREIESAYTLWQRRSGDAERKLQAWRLRLAEIEASAEMPAGKARPRVTFARDLLARIRLPPDHAALVFHLGERGSFVFAGAGGAWEVRRLPPRESLAVRIRSWTERIQKGESVTAEAQALYRDLLGTLSPTVRSRTHWLVALDGALFELPLGALMPSAGRYLIEEHSVQIIPGLWSLESEKVHWTGPAVGVADAVYNTADSRFAGLSRGLFGASEGSPLARLAASADELDAAERSLAQPMVKLTGRDASLAGLAGALRKQPAILHFAAHVLAAPGHPEDSLMALSLGLDGNPELLGPEWIGAREVRSRLVFLSGCRSGRGRILPAEGLMGLARAWLYAGARNVVATHWPTLDEQGSLAAGFYRHWAAGASAAESLRRAQVEAIQAGFWRAEPRHWAAYFVIGSPE